MGYWRLLLYRLGGVTPKLTGFTLLKTLQVPDIHESSKVRPFKTKNSTVPVLVKKKELVRKHFQ